MKMKNLLSTLALLFAMFATGVVTAAPHKNGRWRHYHQPE